MDDALPTSLTEPRVIGAPAVAVGGGLFVLQLMLLCSAHELWLPLVTMLPAVVGAAFVTRPVTERRWTRAAGAAVTWLLGQLLFSVFVLLAMGETTKVVPVALIVTGAMAASMIAVAAPVACAGAVLSGRNDLEAGDRMLGLCGAWLALLQTAVLVLVKELPRSLEYEPGGVVLFGLVGVVLGLGAVGICAGRTLARRRWCERVCRGELRGWRVRRTVQGEELAALPPVFGSPRDAGAVVERVEVRAALYRSGVVGRPLALLRVQGLPGPGVVAPDSALTP